MTGETYNIGGDCEKTNLEVINKICEVLDELLPESSYVPFSDLISFVKDRLGHDVRYAIDASKIRKQLGWAPVESFERVLRKTINWYLSQYKR